MLLDPQLLEESFDLATGGGPDFVGEFYHRLFHAAPATAQLFPANMSEQQDKLWATLRVLRAGLRDLPSLERPLRALGARHVGYGATAAHFPVVCAVLIETMATSAGSAWRGEFTEQWQIMLAEISDIMLTGAHEQPAAAATAVLIPQNHA